MLQQFGFTQYESQVYQALATSNEPLDPSRVVKRSGVPRAKVYEVLDRLGDKGVILESTTEKKRVYAALPIEMLVEKLKGDFNYKIEKLKKMEATDIPTDDRVWTLKDDQSIQVVLKELIQEATVSIFISGWAGDLQKVLPLLENKYAHGLQVTMHVIGQLETKIPDVSVLIPDDYHDSLEQSRTIIIDEREMLFAGIEDREWQAIRTQSRPLVKFFTEFFYHDVALTEITRKYKDIVVKDTEIRNVLMKLRY
ncbi:TrmB family transcriptional regulator [Virgibacillus halodenitrificans]|uniref:TrmB family transcriptional regulator n=1 Tax=Virgibacillus halodenitrificans TaxID=1482 RepID=A0AAC9IVU5_VIRHA|nr:TrmB family transcriptional regulator [Virgibacillus halodenitrificans]APC46952.1 TrmB family transcriptional regulator [Virgibacillus halodenitrificans]MCJ0930252.1 TrmB family transcriptional regulator [Virgibacillus halodenitrificans]MEC2159518.1 helix-turn-helix domain-containing protein [Virgibacillus halodenitrificans]MYL47102.1 TrmB family transcriptional regulator [Virgibacillus halodenitrificans]MYL58290.1 TrmB family transcriptional regulator [Virgibacillus halodenitrificans]